MLRPGDPNDALLDDAVIERVALQPLDWSPLWYAGDMGRRACEDAVKKASSGSFMVFKKSSTAFVVYVNVRGVLSKLTVKVTNDG